jgi:hypothetical protein
VADERDKIRTMMGLPPLTGKDPVVVGGTPFGQAGSVPVADRNAAKEREARQAGYTQAQIDARGGINAQGYFNDVPATQQLTAEEYRSVTKPDGTIDSDAMLAILNKKAGITGGAIGTGAGTGTSAATSAANAEALAKRQSAFDLLREQFAQYGLEGLVDPLRNLIQENVSPSEFAVRLRQTEPYKKRFAANAARIGKGLRALSEAEYITLEDSYQNIMRNYGLPASYYAKGDMGRQEGFEKFIGGDVSPAELEERVLTAQNRVINAPPQVKDALKQFYPDINNSDILAYTLDPEKGLADIKRKVTAAEIGGAAMGAGLATDVGRAEELARFGVTAERAREGYQAAVPIIERGRQLSGFYNESPYTQTTAEEELFGLTYAPEATAKRKRLTALEQASFAGQSGMTGGALSRERAGSF